MNTRRVDPIPKRKLLLVGASLVVVGTFLPWEIEGDFLSYWRYGIQLFPVFTDNGGTIVLLLGALIIALMFRLGDYVKQPIKWILICAIALNVISVYHVVDWLIRRIIANGIIGAPAIKIGLILVVAGSLLTLVATLWGDLKGSVVFHGREISQHHSRDPQ